MRRTVFVVTVSAAALFAGAPALAQTDLRIGSTVQGVLDGQDPVGGDAEMGEHRYDTYSINARAGQRLEAVMRSDAFDAFLEIYAPGADEPFASDDDGLGEGVNSRLRFSAPTAGVYQLRARTLSGLEGGAYSLVLTQRPDAPRAPRPTGIRIGREIAGTLSDRDPEAEDDGGLYDAYAFRASAGQRFAISLNSDAFDPIVHVGRMERGVFTSLAQNDDGPAGGLNSYLVWTAPSAGEYVIRAMSLSGEGQGAYTVGLAEAPPPLPATPIAIGGEVQGELTANAGLNEMGLRADVYSFTVTAGQRVEITMDADAFDAYLELFDSMGQSIAEDDDGGEGTNSRLVRTLDTAGEYRVQARSLGSDGVGAYTLALAEAAPPPAPSALAFGQTIQAEILEEGPTDDDGRSYVDYVFTGAESNRVQIIMRSGDFDTYLQIGTAGEPFSALSQDDDGLGEGTDSRLNFTLPSSGEYVVRASPLGGGGKGLFSIELIDKGPQPEPGSILVGATARGTLGETDGIAEDGAYFDAYRITVAEDEKLEITMTSNDFDAYLDVGHDSDHGWESVVSDDDGLSDTHAKVEWTVEDAGDYVIRARSFASGQTGDYALTVTRKP